ncbi:MAG: hypothetical protein ACR2IP_11240 [Solirubrobacteraceae bacterium]
MDRKRQAAPALLAALVIGGCGSTSLSTRQFRAGASRACLAAARQAERVPTPGSPAGGAAFLKGGIAALRPELAMLRRLRAPRDLARDYGSALAAISSELDALVATARALDRGDDPVIAIKMLQQRLAPIESAQDGAMRTLEIPACVNR